MRPEMASSKIEKSRFYSDITTLLNQRRNLSEASNNMYDTLLRTLSDSDSESEILVQILKDLEQCISLLNKDYQPLVGLIMKMKWLDKGPELISAYQSFMLNLVSAHVFYLKPCLRMVVSKFMPDETNVDESSNEALRKRQEHFTHIHYMLKSISQLIPMTNQLLLQILEKLFPYIKKSVSHFEEYTQNALVITQYMPAQRLSILELVIKNILKLDLRSSRCHISAVIGSQEDVMDTDETMFSMDNLETSAQSSKQISAEGRLTAELPEVGSVDIMMLLMFRYLRDQCYVDGKLDWDITKRLYRELLSVFDKFIFPAHASCHVQFIMFYICSFREALAEGFIDYLWKKVTDPTAQSIYRQSAAFYIGSFLTRAKYLSVKTAKEVVELLVKWIHAYLDRICDQGLCPDLAHHAPFYSLCQSVFYIFCFKHQDFLTMKKGYGWAESLNFQRIVTSKLNPLRVCLPLIVNTFASAARLHQLAFCDTIIERNNRYSLPVTNCTQTIDSSGHKHLETYFPFDPYLLPRSNSFIRPLYKDFSASLAGEDDNEENEDENDFLPSEDEEEDINQLASDVSMSLVKSPADVLQYGISPGFKYV